MGFREWCGRVKRFFSTAMLEIRTVRKVYDVRTGKEITEQDHIIISGYIISPAVDHKIIDAGGRGSKGVVIPAEMCSKFMPETLDNRTLKVHMIKANLFELEDPILIVTNPEVNLEKWLNEGKRK